VDFVSNLVGQNIKRFTGGAVIAFALVLTACGSGTEPTAVVGSEPIAAATSTLVSKKNTYAQAAVPTVYRFAKISNGAYFYTGSDVEAQTILRDYPDFRYEGYAFLRDTSPQGQPVYRFANTRNGGYFYTASIVERDTVLRDLPYFRFEGSTFSVAPSTTTNAKPVYRLANLNNGAYLYTLSATERDYAVSLGMWRSEGTAFNALSPLDGLNCVAAAGGGSGYVLGVCSVVSGGSELISSQFQNFPVTITTDASVAKRFTLNTQSPFLPGARTMDAANENCSDNQVGSKSGFLTEIYEEPARPATSPRYSVLSFAQTVGENTSFCRTPSNQIKEAAFKLVSGGDLTLSDFGTWERYLGGSTLYYGGWYALRTTTNALPAGSKTFSKGLAVGYRFAAGLGYGLSADVATGATWDGTTLNLQINNVSYSRRAEVNPNVLPAISSMTLSGTYSATTKKVSGVVSGIGVSGIFEGEFAGSVGQEFVGKFQLVQAASGDKISGSFAIK
jgi:Repeat of unknown function (DUF5648)